MALDFWEWSRELPCGSSESYLGLLEEQKVLFTSEPSLQIQKHLLKEHKKKKKKEKKKKESRKRDQARASCAVIRIGRVYSKTKRKAVKQSA